MAEETTTTTEQTKPEVAKKDPKEEQREEHKRLQGKKKTTKKKIKHYSNSDIHEEIRRLERAGHQSSVYYQQLQAESRQRAYVKVA